MSYLLSCFLLGSATFADCTSGFLNPNYLNTNTNTNSGTSDSGGEDFDDEPFLFRTTRDVARPVAVGLLALGLGHGACL